jgi:hypothetical protein
MVTGLPPYIANTHYELIKKIKKEPLVFPENLDVTDNCIELIKSLLKTNPDSRMSWDEFFSHPWLRDGSETYLRGSCNLDFVLDRRADSAPPTVGQINSLSRSIKNPFLSRLGASKFDSSNSNQLNSKDETPEFRKSCDSDDSPPDIISEDINQSDIDKTVLSQTSEQIKLSSNFKIYSDEIDLNSLINSRYVKPEELEERELPEEFEHETEPVGQSYLTSSINYLYSFFSSK